MRIKTNVFLVAVTAFLFFGTQAYSQDCGGVKQGKGNGGGVENKIPDLTDKQKEEIKKIDLVFKKQSLPITNELHEKRAHLNTLKTTDPIDQKAIDAQIEAIGKLRTDLAKLQADKKIKVRNTLTDEQKVYFDSHAGQKHKSQGKKSGCGHKCNH